MHIGSELARCCLNPLLLKLMQKALVIEIPFLISRSLSIRGSSPMSGIAEQSELGNNKNLSPCVQQRKIHSPRIIRKNSKVYDLI